MARTLRYIFLAATTTRPWFIIVFVLLASCDSPRESRQRQEPSLEVAPSQTKVVAVRINQKGALSNGDFAKILNGKVAGYRFVTDSSMANDFAIFGTVEWYSEEQLSVDLTVASATDTTWFMGGVRHDLDDFAFWLEMGLDGLK